MTNQTRSAVHDAATKAETLACNLANASSLASVLSEVLDKELGSPIEGQSFTAPITLLDKLKEDGKGLVRPHRNMHGRAANKAPSAGAGIYGGGKSMAQIQVTEEYKKAVEAYEAAFGEKPPYCVKDPEYIMKCVRRGEPSEHVPDPNACY